MRGDQDEPLRFRWIYDHVEGPVLNGEDVVFGQFCYTVFHHFHVHLEVCALPPVLVLESVFWQGDNSASTGVRPEDRADGYLGWAAAAVVE